VPAGSSRPTTSPSSTSPRSLSPATLSRPSSSGNKPRQPRKPRHHRAPLPSLPLHRQPPPQSRPRLHVSLQRQRLLLLRRSPQQRSPRRHRHRAASWFPCLARAQTLSLLLQLSRANHPSAPSSRVRQWLLLIRPSHQPLNTRWPPLPPLPWSPRQQSGQHLRQPRQLKSHRHQNLRSQQLWQSKPHPLYPPQKPQRPPQWLRLRSRPHLRRRRHHLPPQLVASLCRRQVHAPSIPRLQSHPVHLSAVVLSSSALALSRLALPALAQCPHRLPVPAVRCIPPAPSQAAPAELPVVHPAAQGSHPARARASLRVRALVPGLAALQVVLPA
jgi:hypothetical protein